MAVMKSWRCRMFGIDGSFSGTRNLSVLTMTPRIPHHSKKKTINLDSLILENKYSFFQFGGANRISVYLVCNISRSLNHFNANIDCPYITEFVLGLSL